MDIDPKRIVALALPSILVLACSSFLAWLIFTWNQMGWVGMVFYPPKVETGKEVKLPRLHFSRGIAKPGGVGKVFYGGPAYEAGIRAGDEIVEINGIPTNKTERLAELASGAKPGELLNYRVRRAQEELCFTVKLKSPLKTTHIIIALSTRVLLSLTFLLVGLTVYWKKRSDTRALVFYFMSVLAAANFLLSLTLEYTPDAVGLAGGLLRPSVQDGLILFSFVVVLLLPPLLLHFSLVFPKDRPVVRRHRHLFLLVYGLPILAMLSFAILTFAHLASFPSKRTMGLVLVFLLLGVLLLLFLIVALGYSMATVVALVRSYRGSGLEERKQLQWPLWAVITSVGGRLLLGVILLVLLALFPGQNPALGVGDEIARTALWLPIPLAFAFAILKYRLMDIQLVVKKTILYTLLTGILVVLYFTLVGGVGGLLARLAGVQSQWIIIGSTLVIAAAFMPLKSRVQGLIDRRFFRLRRDYPQALRLVSRGISEGEDLGVLLQHVAETLQGALQNRAVVIFTRSPHDRAFSTTAKVGVPDEIFGELKFEPESRLLTMIDGPLALGQSELAEEERLKLRKAGGSLVVPIRLKGELIGFFSLGSKLSDEEYSPEDIEFLLAAAEQTAVGINDVRLRKQEQEFEQAREIQEGLLPKEIPQLPGYHISGAWHPARAVGGDYFDVFRLGENKLAFCIGDVAGKGTSAALLMSNLQATVKAFAGDRVSPKELCKKVNAAICNNTAADRFITFFYGVLEAEKNNIVYTNAGHNPPILLRAEGTVIRLDQGGLVLGIFPDCEYQEGEMHLSAGDRLLLFTDGLVEATRTEEGEFGEGRLVRQLVENHQLGALGLQEKLMATVREFCHGDFDDDVTLVVLSVE
jgi:serine phosphatase RsbU (regulator of sigma subunit)